MQEPKMNLQIYQGAGFQKGGVFNSTGAVGMDRPAQGFMAGAVYGLSVPGMTSGGMSGMTSGGMSGGALPPARP